MPPKKKDAKQERGEQKAFEKQKQKLAEDKTFGLKNKNKSKTVQKYIKGIQNNAKPPPKPGEAQKKPESKEEKKKRDQQAQLLASILRGTDDAKKAADKNSQAKIYDPKSSREDQKINLYIDQREQKMESMKQEDKDTIVSWLNNSNKTEIICKYFLQAVERKQYGWFWSCPNGGDSCIYKHCLPPGYVLKQTEKPEEKEEEVLTLEEIIENERAALTSEGTPVTLETFTAWKKKKEEERKKNLEDQRKAEAQKTGTKGLHILSGRDLFAYDPSLFYDAEGAADEVDYEVEEETEDIIAENQKTIDEANKAAKNQADLTNLKREDNGADPISANSINMSLFLDEDNVLDELNGLED